MTAVIGFLPLAEEVLTVSENMSCDTWLYMFSGAQTSILFLNKLC